MRRISRLDRALAPLRSRSTTPAASPFVCATCRTIASSFSTATTQQARSTSKPLPRTERLRRKIWGTDQPPGLEDPYGGPSIVEERSAARGDPEVVKESHPELGVSAPAATTAVVDASYEPATSWDGLVEVGGGEVQEVEFEGFGPSPANAGEIGAVEVEAAVRRAVVEVLAAREGAVEEIDIRALGRGRDNTVGVGITGSADAPRLVFGDGVTAESVLQPAAEGEAAAEEVEFSQQQASEGSAEWQDISLQDPEFKFAAFKRITHLTGLPISDAALSSSTTIKALLSHLTTPPKPAKLAEALAQKEQLAELPNVKVFGRRVTPIDREVSVGRWKVIERELAERGLPVTGH